MSAPTLADSDLEQRAEASRKAVKELGGALQGELGTAMKSGGPADAVEVCRVKASAIAAEISKKAGMKVARTSLRLRNPNNTSDAWELGVLVQFEARKAAGQDPAVLEHFEVIAENGRKTFRYMKAIAIAPGAPCLVCHGEKIDPAVSARLKTLYPNDRATGFKTGDLRGAFTVTQQMN